ncbi:hypothetical protein K438DRAFT_1748116 [Mycena galopus ATCC 62051]|nr:hypothetical protein K438DRAFT_1748116 [Mycena galopus ATCC 62051]
MSLSAVDGSQSSKNAVVPTVPPTCKPPGGDLQNVLELLADHRVFAIHFEPVFCMPTFTELYSNVKPVFRSPSSLQMLQCGCIEVCKKFRKVQNVTAQVQSKYSEVQSTTYIGRKYILSAQGYPRYRRYSGYSKYNRRTLKVTGDTP